MQLLFHPIMSLRSYVINQLVDVQLTIGKYAVGMHETDDVISVTHWRLTSMPRFLGYELENQSRLEVVVTVGGGCDDNSDSWWWF